MRKAKIDNHEAHRLAEDARLERMAGEPALRLASLKR